ncbi:MAG: DUF1674 domain-containing protein [Wenzhouxiangellaceae bacterium]
MHLENASKSDLTPETDIATPVQASTASEPASPGQGAVEVDPAEHNRTAARLALHTRVEQGGRSGPDPVRYGDWEKNGRCIDF